MIRNRNRKRGRHDDEDFGDDVAGAGASRPNLDAPNDSDEEQGGGWASDDEEPVTGTGSIKVGDDNVEVKTRDGRITSVEGGSASTLKIRLDPPSSQRANVTPGCLMRCFAGEEDEEAEDEDSDAAPDDDAIPIVPFNLKTVRLTRELCLAPCR